MKLSVVIVSYNAVDFLRLTLNSVFAACKNIQAEVFVVDNNSTEPVAQMINEEFSACQLIANSTNPGFSIANNQAIQQAQGEYILILNPDTIVAEDTFEKILEFAKIQPNTGGIGIRMLDGSGTFLPESKRGIPLPWTSFSKMSGLSSFFPKSRLFSEYHKGYLSETQNSSVEVLAGAFMLFKKTVLDDIGLLDEDFFMYGEDIDLSFRALKNNYTNYYFCDSSIIHFKGESTIKNKVYVDRFYKAMIQFAYKHFSKSYSWLLKILINSGIILAKTLNSVKNACKIPEKESDVHNQLLLLNDYLPAEDLIEILEIKYQLKIIKDLSKEQQGIVLFVENQIPYKQMIEYMDTYKNRFVYRFLNPEQRTIVGSDNKFEKGNSVRL